MQTFDLRVYVGGAASADDLTGYLLGERVTRPYGIFGAVELNDDNMPVGQIPVRPGVKWDGFPVHNKSDVKYTMTTANNGKPVDEKTRQSVTVYEYRDGETKVVTSAEDAVTVIAGEPMPATVNVPGQTMVYSTHGVWTPIEGVWVCAARMRAM